MKKFRLSLSLSVFAVLPVRSPHYEEKLQRDCNAIRSSVYFSIANSGAFDVGDETFLRTLIDDISAVKATQRTGDANTGTHSGSGARNG